MTATQREIHTGFATADDMPGTWQAYAECDDEKTSVIVMNGGDLFPVPTEAAFLSSEWPERLVAEHLERCAACASWRGTA